MVASLPAAFDALASPVTPPSRFPRRDAIARARLAEVAGRVQPFVPAGERLLPVAGDLAALLPGGGLRRGSVIALDGVVGAGATTVAFMLAAAATAVGEWAVALDDGTLGGVAAAQAGVELERFAVVRTPPRERWATVAAALLDGVTLVVATVPPFVRAADARRLVARGGERSSVLVAIGAWPVEAALRLRVEGVAWSGLQAGAGLLAASEIAVCVEGKGRPAHGPVRARAG